jgi:hypothetical protein
MLDSAPSRPPAAVPSGLVLTLHPPAADAVTRTRTLAITPVVFTWFILLSAGLDADEAHVIHAPCHGGAVAPRAQSTGIPRGIAPRRRPLVTYVTTVGRRVPTNFVPRSGQSPSCVAVRERSQPSRRWSLATQPRDGYAVDPFGHSPGTSIAEYRSGSTTPRRSMASSASRTSAAPCAPPSRRPSWRRAAAAWSAMSAASAV